MDMNKSARKFTSIAIIIVCVICVAATSWGSYTYGHANGYSKGHTSGHVDGYRTAENKYKAAISESNSLQQTNIESDVISELPDGKLELYYYFRMHRAFDTLDSSHDSLHSVYLRVMNGTSEVRKKFENKIIITQLKKMNECFSDLDNLLTTTEDNEGFVITSYFDASFYLNRYEALYGYLVEYTEYLSALMENPNVRNAMSGDAANLLSDFYDEYQEASQEVNDVITKMIINSKMVYNDG